MRKRKQPPRAPTIEAEFSFSPEPTAEDSDPAPSPDEDDVTAVSVVKAHKDQQKKRRMRARTPGSRVKTSIWTTICATPVEGETPMSQCNVCDTTIRLNASGSSGNMKDHYAAIHKHFHDALVRLNSENATEEMLKEEVEKARRNRSAKHATKPIHSFFRPKAGTSSMKAAASDTESVPVKTVQAVTLVLYSCATETPFRRAASPLTQGFVDVLGGRLQYSSHEPIESHLYVVYKAVCNLLKGQCESAHVGNITLDGWSAALGTPILGITWNFIDSSWCLKCIPICMLNTGTASKSAEQLRSIVTELLKQSMIVGSDNIRIHTATSDNEPAVGLACDLFTNFSGSVRCVVHTLALCVNDVFTTTSPWKAYMTHINKVTSYFNFHTKANLLFLEKQRKAGVTDDRLHRLKHDVATRWHSRLGAMVTYLTELDHISAVTEELSIDADAVPSLTVNEQNTLAEFIKVLAEVRRVARQLEADRKVTMSRAPRVLRELHETLCIMGENMERSTTQYFQNTPPTSALGSDRVTAVDTGISSFRSIQSTANHCQKRDEARSERLHKQSARKLALELAEKIEERFGSVWRPVDSSILEWEPKDGERPPASFRLPLRVVLFHIAALMDINECEFEWLQLQNEDKDEYISSLYAAVAREAIALGETGLFNQSQLKSMFGLFHGHMRAELKKRGRKSPEYALKFWKGMNETVTYTSPLAFNTVARAFLSTQASSASAERLFSDLGRTEGRERQSLMSSTLEMTEMIRVFVNMDIEDSTLPQRGLQNPKAVAFKRTVQKVARKVNQDRLNLSLSS